MRHAETVATSRSMTTCAVSRCVSAPMMILCLTLLSHADSSSRSSSDDATILNLTIKDFDASVAEMQHLFVEFCEYMITLSSLTCC